MSFGSFKDKIKSAVSAVKDEVIQTAEAAVDDQTSGWSDKVSAVTSEVTGLAGMTDGLTSKLSGGSAGADTPLGVTVQAGGQTLDAKKVFIAKIQTRHAVNEIPGATVVMTVPQSAPDDHTALDALLNHCKVGQPVTLKMGKIKVFDGVVGVLQVVTDENGWRVTMRLKHNLQGLKATIRSRVCKAGPDAALVRQILSEHAVHIGAITLPESKPVQREQVYCSDWLFFRALLGLHGAWLWPQTDGSVKVQAPKMGGKTHTVPAKPGAGGIKVINAEWGYSGLPVSKGMTVRTWDIAKQAVVRKSAKNKTLGSGGLSPSAVKALGLASEVLLNGQYDSALQQAAADSRFMAQHAQAVRLRLTLAGCQPFQLGDTVSLTGFGSHLSGQGLVTQVEYQCDQRGRMGETIVGVGLDEDAALSPDLPMFGGATIGIIAPFKADPNHKWDRLPVKVVGGEVQWARAGHLYASKESGDCMYPEEGDEVVVAYVGGDLAIVSAVHNPKRAAPYDPTDKNAKKGFVFRHGGKRSEWMYDRDKQTVTTELGDDKKPEQHMVLDAKKGLTFTSAKGDIKAETKEGGMAVTAKKNIALKADEQVTVKAKTGISAHSEKNVTLAAETKLQGTGKTGVDLASEKGKLSLNPEKATLSADQLKLAGTMTAALSGNESVSIDGTKVDIKGKAEVAVSAAKVAVKGEAEASLEASAEVKVAGQITEVGGAGITNVKGSMVNLG